MILKVFSNLTLDVIYKSPEVSIVLIKSLNLTLIISFSFIKVSYNLSTIGVLKADDIVL